MAKKILGDDPFSTQSSDADKTPPVAKTKRAPQRKIEAPRATRAKSSKMSTPKPATPKAKTAKSPIADITPVAASVVHTAPIEAAPLTEVALTPPVARVSSDEPTAGSWRFWRVRQQQLARAEEAAWLARADALADRFGRDPALAGRAEPIVDLLYRSVMRVSVRGLGHVPEQGRAILVSRRRAGSTHGMMGLARDVLERLGLVSPSAALDAALIAHAIRTEHVAHREVRPLVRPARLYTPVFGALLRRLGAVPADVHDLARLLDDDRLALAFVGDGDKEARGGSTGSARRGDEVPLLDARTLVSLALVTGAPIVPVVIAGATGTLFSTARRTALAFGMPLFPGTEFGPEGAEDTALVERLAAELDAQLQQSKY